MFLSLVLLCACDGSDEALSDRTQQAGEALKLTVSAGDFVTYGDTPDTRATDGGAATTFENGDRIGVIVLDNRGNLLSDNIPYKYNGSSWSFDSSNGEGKSAVYYDNKAKTYLVYFPYSTDSDGVTAIEGYDGLKSKFIPKKDQQTEENYRASDLMTWQSTSDIAQKTLNVTLTHAYNSVSIQPKVHYTLNDGQDTDFLYPDPAISAVYFLTGDTRLVTTFSADDGSYRYILPADFTGDVRCFYILDNKTYNKAFTVSSVQTSNIRYGSVQNIRMGTYSLDMARLGDFYCKNSRGEGYLIPNEAESLPEGTECIGIVYWLGDIKGDNYGLLDGKFPDGTHGLVVSLWELECPAPLDNPTDKLQMQWTYGGYEYVNTWLANTTWSGNVARPNGFTSIQVDNKMQGYANTVALIEYNTYVEGQTGDGCGSDGNKRVKPVKGLAAFQKAHPAPSNSSGWYWPSVYELKYVCWGQGNGQSTSGKNMLNTKIGKLSGNTFYDNGYWSSTESSNVDYYAQWVGFRRGTSNDGRKHNSTCRVRPVLAF